MSYDENRISDLIDGGLHEQKQLHISGVSGSIKELNHYCRKRDCVFHNGISKRDNVMCSHKSPEIVSDKDGTRRCFSYCH
jgi:hypothetical protein